MKAILLFFSFLLVLIVNGQTCYQQYLKSGILLFNAGKLDDAEKDFKVALRCPDANKTEIGRWINNVKNARTRKGVTGGVKKTPIRKKDFNYYFERGRIKYNSSEFSEAVNAFDEAEKFDGSIASLYYNRALCYYYLENQNEAIRDFSKAIEIDNTYDKAYLDRGDSYNVLDKMKDACDDYKKAASLGNADGPQRLKKYCPDVENLKVEMVHNQFINNKLGMKIYPKFEIANAKGLKGDIIAFFYNRDHTTELPAVDSEYKVRNQVAVQREINPRYDTTYYNNDENTFPLFIPHSAIKASSSGTKYYLSFFVAIYIDDVQVGTSDWVDFDLTYD